MRIRVVFAAAAALAGAGCLAGCSQAIGEGVALYRGAGGSVTPLTGESASVENKPLAGYTGFELGTFTDDMGGNVPAGLFQDLPPAFKKLLAEKRIPNTGGKTLLVTGRVLHYEDSSVVGMALGPVEFVVARVTFADQTTGQVVGTANCVGQTKKRVNVGVRKKAQGLAKAIVKWIDERFPDGERVSKE